MPTEGLDLPIPHACCVFVASPSRGLIVGSPREYVFDTHIRDIPSGCPLAILIPREPRSPTVCYLPRVKSWGLELAVRATEQVHGTRLMPQFLRSLDFGQAAHKKWRKGKAQEGQGEMSKIYPLFTSPFPGIVLEGQFSKSLLRQFLLYPLSEITKTLN